ncbi:unnamed protein product [Lepeophtheirus salmonis]|uniref:(salmon louse) hypothetical protein n=1 Tax=Lepeophtheirus salmonis TaxID=72036 RepID=A0A7R8D368_LEPSM|nr:unnamed protein product [Lepeophtheirus salmonis]CAF3014220.1 unnamed protein product [Lepeophtheirus salmonis]
MTEDNTELISYHCIIHQLVFCSTLSDEYAEVRKISDKYDKHFLSILFPPAWYAQMQQVDLKADVALKEHFRRTDPATLWHQKVLETTFSCLRKVAFYIFTMFGYTYSYKAAFSTMPIITTKYCSRSTKKQLHMFFTLAFTHDLIPRSLFASYVVGLATPVEYLIRLKRWLLNIIFQMNRLKTFRHLGY